jgi:hypothetical protein
MEKRGKKKSVSKKDAPKKERKVIEDEIFQVEKDGEEKIIRKEIFSEPKTPSAEQLKGEKKTLIKIIVVLMGFILMFIAFYLINYYSTHFNVEGVKFEIDKTSLSGVTLYKTTIPGMINNEGNFTAGIYGESKQAYYRIWFRNDPRTLDDIAFSGEVVLLKNIVLNMTDSFNCNGDGIIAIANLQKTYNAIGATIMKDETATCDEAGRYTFLRISEENETKITEYNSAGECYKIEINNCEILPATEKFMLELLKKINEEMKK